MREKFYKVDDAMSAGKLVAELESKDKVVGFGTYKLLFVIKLASWFR